MVLGIDRRFNKIRYDVVFYIEVGINTIITFYDLSFISGTVIYYFIVIAYSKSFFKIMVIFNGFIVGDGGGIIGKICFIVKLS